MSVEKRWRQWLKRQTGIHAKPIDELYCRLVESPAFQRELKHEVWKRFSRELWESTGIPQAMKKIFG